MNRYNPHIRPRRSIRLKGQDYAQAGFYFVTICCKDNMCRFGRVENGEMILNEFGIVARDKWMKLAERFPNIEIDVFQIMPNHMHGIIILHITSLGATLAVAPKVSDIVGAYKSLVSNDCLSIYKSKNEIAMGAKVAPTENV